MTKLQRYNIQNLLFKYFGIICTVLVIGILVMLLGTIFYQGFERISWDFLTNLPSRFSEKSGIYTALAGMVAVLLLTVLISFPIGISAAIYLEEYGTNNRFAKFIEVNIANLAGVPSVIYGILGLGLFVRLAGWGNSILAASFTLALLILPIIIVSTREAIRAVPNSLREASLAMGATRLQTIWSIVLPASMGGIITGMILAISRAIGETAPLIVIGALVYVPFLPESPMDQFTVLPIQIFNWIGRPQAGFAVNAAAGIIILLLFTFILNGIAVYLRNRWYKKTSA